MINRVHKGFTLIEIAVIVAVISVIATMTIVAYTTVQKQSRDQRRTSDITAYRTALKSYLADNNEFPPACGADNAGCNVSNLSSYLVPKYMNEILHDPKSGTDYSYVRGTVTATPAYGIIVYYEASGTCKTGVNVASGWWGTGTPTCADGV
jgi:prepilin-type N-terminal cleavage/methylation domain-containing protein